MTSICLYFQVHQPNRLRKYTYFDIGNQHYYENEETNRNILLKIANKCYLPTNTLLLALIKKYKGDFKVSYSISGTIIEQFKKFSPETLDSFKLLADTGYVEFINETYYHSLSFLFSQTEFAEQIKLHKELIAKEFNYTATTFRNTELIYNDDLALFIDKLGYKTILTEGADKILGWRSPNFVYHPDNCKNLKLLLKNYRLSDDVAFRFSERTWPEYPLTADKYSYWIHALHGKADIINLFMDYETFGEHQWQETGIFGFLEKLPEYIFKHPGFNFMLPSEASKSLKPIAPLHIPNFISWADVERDLTAWRGNVLQEDALQSIYSLEQKVKATKNEQLIKTWRALQTSDHFYYMCTKYDTDGDVHKYFNPYHSPYEAYINYQNIIGDFTMEIEKRGSKHD
jgi:alpha-amylase